MLAFTTASVGAAQVGAQPSVQLKYDAPLGCPTETEFIDAVDKRGGAIQQLDAHAGDRALDISITKEGRGFAGAIRTRHAGAVSSPREVRGASCADVVEALAVVAALELQPRAEASAPNAVNSAAPVSSQVSPLVPAAAPVHSSPPVAGEPPAPSTVGPPSAGAPDSDEASHSDRPGIRVHGEVGSKTVPVPAGTLRFERLFTLAAYGGGMFGLIPGAVTPRVDVSLSRAHFVTTPDLKSYMVGPVFKMRASMIIDANYRSSEVSVRAHAFTFGAGMCFSPLYDTDGFMLTACGEVGLGDLRSQTTSAADNETLPSEDGFGILGVELEGKYRIVRSIE